MTKDKQLVEQNIIKVEGEERKDGKRSFQIGKTEWWIISESDSKIYFYNAETKLTSWKLPEQFYNDHCDEITEIGKIHGVRVDTTNGGNEEKLEDNNRLQNVKAIKNGQNGVQMDPVRSKKSERIPKTEWWVIDDPSAPKIYYYNASEDKTTWDLPEEIKRIYKFTLGKNDLLNNEYNRRITENVASSPYTEFLDKKRDTRIGNRSPTKSIDYNYRFNATFPDAKKDRILAKTGNKYNNYLSTIARSEDMKNFALNYKSKIDLNGINKFKSDLKNDTRMPNIHIPKDINYADTRNFIRKSPHTDLSSNSRFNTNWWLTGQKDKIEDHTSADVLIVQKKKWQRKYIKLVNKMVELQQKLDEKELLKLENKEEKAKEMPEKEDDLLIKTLSLCGNSNQLGLLRVLSITDLRQTAIMKAMLSNRNSLEAMCLSLIETEQVKSSSKEKSHPTYFFSRGDSSNKYDKNKVYFCLFCSERFEGTTQLEKHLRQHCISFIMKENKQECLFCQKEFPSKMLKELHQRCNHPAYMDFIDNGIRREISNIKGNAGLKRKRESTQPPSELRYKPKEDEKQSQCQTDKDNVLNHQNRQNGEKEENQKNGNDEENNEKIVDRIEDEKIEQKIEVGEQNGKIVDKTGEEENDRKDGNEIVNGNNNYSVKNDAADGEMEKNGKSELLYKNSDNKSLTEKQTE